LEARIANRALAVVRRAAEIQGRSVGDVVLSAAQEAAQRTIANLEVIRLSRKAQERLAALLSIPPPPTAALARDLKRHRVPIAK
jgi:uncharacterized protein (DUF1778 family)